MAAESSAEAIAERRIMVAVDEGEESMYALSWSLTNLVSQEEDSRDTLILLYAKPPRVVYTAMDATGRRRSFEGYLFSSDMIATMEKYTQEIAESVLEKAKEACRGVKNVKIETRAETGDPRDVICEMVDKLGIDVLVMGSHGYGIIKRAFLGSVSNHCAQNANCPVLIVKKPKN